MLQRVEPYCFKPPTIVIGGTHHYTGLTLIPYYNKLLELYLILTKPTCKERITLTLYTLTKSTCKGKIILTLYTNTDSCHFPQPMWDIQQLMTLLDEYIT